MQDIQHYPSHPAYANYFNTSRTSRPRDPFKTPEKKTQARNYSPSRKSMGYEQSRFQQGFEN